MAGIRNSYVAYCLDEAVNAFCTTVESELEKANDAKTKTAQHMQRQTVLQNYLGIKPKYRDPVGLAGKKKKQSGS